ncbi:hypothetical protein [Paraburkholderia sp. CNPSo 3281]|uniref:hypothetical protein n=1 Tax=Paraburkholderia sp. CNPSo 3281 TaxID=2940933 RepID=UPI0020B6A850|nr:hypothetical protein [Paraburkholderia sp. CNPSo 3281]MCP3720810.1 hypothetical protein [Paraburkholderia sp. CNPSo 3281]
MLIEEIHALVAGLSAPWKSMLRQHGLDLSSVDSPQRTAEVLSEKLNIDWQDPRVQDLCRSTERAIEPGDPARSLLYHLLALSECPSPDGGVSLEDIELLENYLYSLAPLPSDWTTLDVAVLAYQYRPARRTGHQQHADMVFSRLGIARNGDTEAHYDANIRCFVPHVKKEHKDERKEEAKDEIEIETEHVRVLPARYGAFLVRRVSGPDGLSLIEGEQRGDAHRAFIQPVRKLFSREFLPGMTLALDYGHAHSGEKLKRAVLARWGISPDPSGNLDHPPYSIVCRLPDTAPSATPGAASITLKRCGDSVLLMPAARPLIEPVTSANYAIKGFPVPAQWPFFFSIINRRYTTLRLFTNFRNLILAGIAELREQHFPNLFKQWVQLQFPEPRNTPEFVNIRHMRDENGTYTDMRTHPIRHSAFLKKVVKGGYDAQMFLDHCLEGAVTVRIKGLPNERVLPAFSIVAAPDFFPYADQAELQRWFDEEHIDPKTQFRNGSPLSLSAERLSVNPAHVDSFSLKPAFSNREDTISVSFSLLPRAPRESHTKAKPPRIVSFLSDASSGVFAPGWDVTYAGDHGKGIYLATFGLGSPFAEDIKLCAASNSFWPAVSPDASRTFNRSDAPTAIPMLDCELGFHPQHPLVTSGVLHDSRTGWDGEHGPFLTPEGMVDYADIDRSDYVANALAGKMLYGAFEHVDAVELIRRIKALRLAVAACDPGQTPATTQLWLVSASELEHQAGTHKRYRFLFVLPEDGAKPGQHVPGRLRIRYGEAVRCEATESQLVGNIQRCAPGPKALRLY